MLSLTDGDPTTSLTKMDCASFVDHALRVLQEKCVLPKAGSKAPSSLADKAKQFFAPDPLHKFRFRGGIADMSLAPAVPGQWPSMAQIDSFIAYRFREARVQAFDADELLAEFHIQIISPEDRCGSFVRATSNDDVHVFAFLGHWASLEEKGENTDGAIVRKFREAGRNTRFCLTRGSADGIQRWTYAYMAGEEVLKAAQLGGNHVMFHRGEKWLHLEQLLKAKGEAHDAIG